MCYVYNAAMQISAWVSYDEQRLRRTLQFTIHPQLKPMRILGGLLSALGLVLMLLQPAMRTLVLSFGVVVLGLLCVVAIEPIVVARSMRMQPDFIKDGSRITIGDEWVTISHPFVELRLRWVGLGRIVETPEAWYAMFGKIQAIMIPKDSLTAEQRFQFAAFADGLRLAGDCGAARTEAVMAEARG